ncbi:hypothetical protein [Saccharothrix syringae]|uniref:hypothetical protein n=1 Tax=Saccharothrix syringae TaxID=103733 RepID=UPI001B80ADA7|nr:hypothetical protein [Saccharothrix syringae]
MVAIGMMRTKGWVVLVGFVISVGMAIVVGAVGRPVYLAVFGQVSECEVLRAEEVDTSKYDTQMWYSLQCGDRRYDDVYLDDHNHPRNKVGDRVSVVFDRFGLLSPDHAAEAKTTYAWGLPLALLAALGFVAFAATRPLEPVPPRRS